MIQVYEDPAGLNYLTSYSYDALDALITVNQGSQTRSFVYDSLTRLISATNPESGTVNYQYDNNGNPLSKTDARNITTNYVYDALNRVTSRSYQNDPSGTPAVIYTYDSTSVSNGRGRLASVSSSVSTYSYSGYDGLGRVTGGAQTLGSQSYSLGYSYDLAGHVLAETYPSGHTVNYTYDNAGRTNSLTGNLGDGISRSYASAFLYNSSSQITQELFGTNTPLYHKLQYNVRGQLWDVRVSTAPDVNGSWNRGCLQFFYDSTYGYGTSGPDNNGNVLKSWHYIPLDDQASSWAINRDTYSYDSLNRITSVSESYLSNTQMETQQFLQTYSYDRYGNRLIDQANTWGTGIPKPSFGVDANTNRLTAPAGYTMSYDQAGNLTNDTYTGEGQRTYDGEQRLKQAWANNQWQTYTYDAEGRRVRRNVNAVETWQVYGLDGELLAEYPQNGAAANPQKEYGYRDGQLLVTADVSTGSAAPIFTDNFNSNSLDTSKWSVVDPNSTAVVSDNGQQLQITLQPNTAAYNGVYSNSTFDITNKSVQVEVAQPISQAGWCENFMDVVLDGNNYFLIDSGAGSMVFRSMVGGVNDQTILQVFDPAVEHYWRIRHDPTANTINFETSADNSSWTTRKTAAVGFSLASLRFYLYAGAWGTGNSAPGTAKYDNFQLGSNTPVTTANINWLVTDQLGTPRMVVDKSGSLASIKRHDYLPFGEELLAGVGGRTTTQGYSGDSVRQKFTQKERDNETGLDYFGARYYGSTQERFTSADPLLSSGSIYDPQTWNRYSYVLNNPLVSTDPLGLFVWGNVTDEDKERIRSAFKQATSDLEKIGKLNGTDSQEYTDAKRALDSYGKEGVDNGVTVSVGALRTKGASAETDISRTLAKKTADNPNGQNITVTFAAQTVGGDTLEGAAMHEGSHVADGSQWVKSGFSNAMNPTVYQTEFRAFTVESLFVQAGNPNGFAKGILPGAFVPGKAPYIPEPFALWDSGWKSADVATLRSANINKILARPTIAGGAYEVTPLAQGGKAFGRKAR